MKRWIAILLAACLMLGAGAMAQEEAEGAADASKLPAPDVVAEIESVGEPEDAQSAPENTGETADAETAEATEIPEAEPTEEPAPDTFDVWFEEGFGLTLPEGWVRYAVPDEDSANGIRYTLGDGSGARNLYIQIQPTRISDVTALSEAVENTDGLTKTGALTFGDTDFVAFIDARQNLSCCATLWGNEVLVFMFTPQTDSDFMLTASRLMESFKVL